MASEQTVQRLVVIQGPTEGKRYELRKGVVTIGADGGCTVRVQGGFVGNLHAVIERSDDGRWRLTNRSVNGTLVNQERIDTRTLNAGDVIQIGSDTLLVYEEDEPKRKARDAKAGKADRKPASARLGAIGNPLVVAGIAVYVGAIIAAAVWFTRVRGAEALDVLPASLAAEAIEHTRRCLGRIDPLSPGDKAVTGRDLDARAEPAARYFGLMALKAKSAPASERQPLIDAILGDLEGRLFRAWNLESQGRWNEASQVYDGITAALPDIRCGSAQLAVHRKKIVQANAQKKR